MKSFSHIFLLGIFAAGLGYAQEVFGPPEPVLLGPSVVQWESFTFYGYDQLPQHSQPPTPIPASGGYAPLVPEPPKPDFHSRAEEFAKGQYQREMEAFQSNSIQRELQQSEARQAATQAATQAAFADVEARMAAGREAMGSASSTLMSVADNFTKRYDTRQQKLSADADKHLAASDKKISQSFESLQKLRADSAIEALKTTRINFPNQNRQNPLNNAEDKSDYKLRAPPSAQRDALEAVQNRLVNLKPSGEAGVSARRIGLESVVLADNALVNGSNEEAAFYTEVAIAMADIGLGFVPFVGWGKDVYEAITGTSLLTGEDIGFSGRSFAMLGVLTAGGATAAVAGGKALLRLVHSVAKAGDLAPAIQSFNLASEIARTTKTIERFSAFHTPGPLAKREAGGGKFMAETFHAASYVKNEVVEPTKLYRVFSDDARRLGLYWTRVQPNGPLQATLDDAISPTFKNSAHSWVEITVPKGEIVFEGKAAAIAIPGGSLFGHGHQAILERVKIPAEWVTDRGKFRR
jgi:hypothetical protein